MPISNYPHGFANGITIRDLPLILTQSKYSNVFWVDSTKGSDGNVGSFTKPLATIQYANGLCKDYNDDLIIVAAGHIEVVNSAGGLTIDTIGVTILFLGFGHDRGRIQFVTSVNASLVISANSVTLINPWFLGAKNGLLSAIQIAGKTFVSILNGFYTDETGVSTVNQITATSANTLTIDGWMYYEGGAPLTIQKVSGIAVTGISNSLLNIDIYGDFSSAPIVLGDNLDSRLESIYVRNLNAGPKPGMVIGANTSGMAKNIDIRIASGTTFVSSVGKLNWDNDCLGYNIDGQGGDPIGTVGSGTIEGKIDDIQTDIGDPSARTNFKSLETMIGIPDAANSCLDDMLRTGYDSTPTVGSADGSVLERLEFIQASLASPQGDFYKVGTCDAGMGASATTIVAADLSGYGEDFFNTKYYMQVIVNANSHGAAPETQIRQITNYVTATGTFTVNAFGANVEASDKIAIIHQSLISGTNPVGTDIASILAVTNAIPDAGALTTMSGEVTAIKAVTDVLPDAGALTTMSGEVTAIKAVTDVLPDAGALTTMSGEVTAIKAVTDVLPDAGALTTIDGNASNASDQSDKIDSATLSATPTAGSLATFIASGSTALGTALAASKSIIDAIGSNGSALVYGSGSVLGAIGTTFIIKKTMVSSAILESAAVDITGVSSGGELLIEDVVVKTDGTGLAAATNFELKSNNARGELNFFVETVANLGASKTVDMNGVSVTGEHTVIETGKKLQVHATVTDCTGAGEIDIYVKFRRLAAGATIAAL